MSLKKIISTVAVSVIAMGSLIPAASARDYGRHGGEPVVGYRPHVERQASPQHFGGGYGRYGHAPRRHRNHTGRNIAIGAFAAVFGLALAAESQRVGRDYYEDRD